MDAELLARAREMLDDVRTWRLPPAAWSRPAAAIAALAAAYEAGNAVAMNAAVAALEVLSPNRVERITESADVPPPQPLDEQVTALVHIIAEPGTATAAETGHDDKH